VAAIQGAWLSLSLLSIYSFAIMKKLFAESDACLLCGGALLAISIPDKASCGIGIAVNMGFSQI